MNQRATFDTPIPATREHELAVLVERASDPTLEWRSLDWLPGYQVSELGHMRRTVASSNYPAGYVRTPYVGKAGYVVYSVRIEGKMRLLTAHRLVCEAFHGAPPFKGAQVAHADGVRIHNHYTNLRWATARENHLDRQLHGTDFNGERGTSCVLTLDEVREVRGLWGKVREGSLARRYGVSLGAIRGIVTLRTWRPARVGATEPEARIILGTGGCTPVDHPLYDEAEWRSAAQGALDADDYRELSFMALREEFYQRWMDLSDARQEEWCGFENWWEGHRSTWEPAARNADRVASPVDITNVRHFPNIGLAADHLASLPADERERLNREWAA